MKKVWDFLLLLVSGLLVFVAVIAVALWLSQDDEPPATADSRGGSTVQGGHSSFRGCSCCDHDPCHGGASAFRRIGSTCHRGDSTRDGAIGIGDRAGITRDGI